MNLNSGVRKGIPDTAMQRFPFLWIMRESSAHNNAYKNCHGFLSFS